MVTDMEIMPTLIEWLTWLKNLKAELRLKRIMIDCSATEIGAIRSVFGDEVDILLCHWHVWRAWDKNMKKEVGFRLINESILASNKKIHLG